MTVCPSSIHIFFISRSFDKRGDYRMMVMVMVDDGVEGTIDCT